MERDKHHQAAELNYPKVLITGASGFIGGHVTRFFAEKGHEVTCLVREASDLSFISDLPVTFVHGDILDNHSLKAHFSGMDLVIHTAGKVSDWGTYTEFYRDNVEGTMNVLEAVLHNGISRVIITGSVSSYGEEDANELKNEGSGYNSHYSYAFDNIFPSGMNHYRDTKALLTQRSVAFGLKHKLDLFILEPVWVYGENEFSSGFYEYLKLAAAGIPFMPGNRKNRFHVVHARDLARAYWLASQSQLQGVQRIIIGNNSTITMIRLMELFCRAAGCKTPALLPKYVAYPAGLLLELGYLLARKKNPPPLTRARVNMYYDSIGYETDKAARVLGFEDSIPLEEGVRETVDWYRRHHYL